MNTERKEETLKELISAGSSLAQSVEDMMHGNVRGIGFFIEDVEKKLKAWDEVFFRFDVKEGGFDG